MPNRSADPLAHVVVDEYGCWIWQGHISKLGYGHLWVPGTPKRKQRTAYRVIYELLRGPVPDGLELDHLCRVRACCNPDHLEPVTHAVNMARASRGRQTHCKRGHEFTPENTYWQRSCRACQPAYAATYRSSKRESRKRSGGDSAGDREGLPDAA